MPHRVLRFVRRSYQTRKIMASFYTFYLINHILSNKSLFVHLYARNNLQRIFFCDNSTKTMQIYIIGIMRSPCHNLKRYPELECFKTASF